MSLITKFFKLKFNHIKLNCGKNFHKNVLTFSFIFIFDFICIIFSYYFYYNLKTIPGGAAKLRIS